MGSVKRPYVQLRVWKTNKVFIKTKSLSVQQTEGLKVGCGGMGGRRDGRRYVRYERIGGRRDGVYEAHEVKNKS